LNASVPVEGAVIIAAMTPPESKAPFNRAQLIVRGADGAIVCAQTYSSDALAEGAALSSEDLQGLMDAGHALAFPELSSLVSGEGLWVLRHGLARRDRALSELRAAGLLVHAPIHHGPNDAWLCLVNEGDARASTLRDKWRDEAMRAATKHALDEQWREAEREAEIAQAVCQGLDAEVLAMLSLTHERCDRAKRSEGVLKMARRSRGDEFGDQVIEALQRLRNTLGGGIRVHSGVHAGLADALRLIMSFMLELEVLSDPDPKVDELCQFLAEQLSAPHRQKFAERIASMDAQLGERDSDTAELLRKRAEAVAPGPAVVLEV
jgi:hypothetical protein